MNDVKSQASDDKRSLPCRELLAALVTFSTMSYILCVQPALMSGQMSGTSTGLDAGALFTSTCLVSAIGCLLMGIWARYPFALAPGMGENFFVVMSVLPLCISALGLRPGNPAAMRLALGVVFVSGAIFLIVSLLGLRSFLINAISPSLRTAFGVGIGLFIADLGFKNAGLYQIVNNQPVLCSLYTWNIAVFALGLLACTVLHLHRVPGAIFWGICVSALFAWFLGKIKISGVFGVPADPSSVLFQIDLPGVVKHCVVLFPSILMLTFMDIFDTFGTVVGVAQKANMMQGNTLPRSERVFATDAIATLVGAVGGHSTVTTFLESATGIESGGRTGLTAVAVGLLFLVALFFAPVILAVGGCPPITACALVFVGMLMMQSVANIDWTDITETLPAFAVITVIPLTGSIAEGIMFGLILWPWLKLLGGRWKEVRAFMYVLSIMLTAYALFVHAKL